MSALIGAYQRAVNRLLPYRALHTDLVAHEEYYTFNDSSATDPEDDLSQWTQGSNALTTDGSATHTYNGEASWLLRADSTPPTNDTDVYVESAATNFHTDIPCTFRVIARAPVSASVWLRVYDPNQALSDAWFHLTAGSTGDPETHSGEVGQTSVNVTEARVTYPIPELTNLGTGGAGDSAHFMLLEMELPAAASRTMRIQVVDADADTDLDVNVLVYIARAEIRQGRVSKWTCRRTGRSFSQATAANQPYARPMGVRRFNGRRVLRFSGSQFLVSDDAATEWDFLHSGVGCSVYAAYMPTTASSLRLMSTSDGASEGIRIRTDIDADTRTGVDIWNGSDTLVTSVYSSNGTTPIDALYIAGYRCQDGHADGDATLDVGGAQYVGNASTWGSSGAPTTTLQIGAEDGAGAFDGYIADIAIYEARLTDDEHARVVEELEGLNASSGSIPGNILWTRYDQGVTASGGVVTALADLSPENQIINSASTDPDFVASSTAFRGSPAILFEVSGNPFSCDAVGAALSGQVERCVIATSLMSELNTSGNPAWIWQLWGSSGESFEGISQVNSNWLFMRRDAGGSTDFLGGTSADRKPHTHSYVTDGETVQTWIDGVADINTTSNKSLTVETFQWSVPGPTGGDHAGTEIAVYDAAPTTYQRQLVERAQRRRMLGGRPLIGGYSVGQITPAPSPGSGPSPLIDNNWLTYLDADAGPVGTPSTAVGNAITDWLSLEVTGGSGPYDFAQSGSADRGVLSDTTASDSRLTVDFDGVSDFMAAVGDLGGELEGNDVDFTRFLHVITINTSGTKDMFSLCNDSGDNRDQIQQLGDDVRSLRRVTTTITNTGADVLTVGEHVIVDMRVGDTRTIWVDGVKVVNAGAESTGSITFSQVILAAVDIGSITNPAQIGVRRAGLRLGGVTDPQAATLAGADGT